MNDTTPWKGVHRTDGLCIAEGVDGWVVIPRDGEVLDRCPCCTRPITAPYYAKLIAGNAFPLDPVP
jgi:hypothetical protein